MLQSVHYKPPAIYSMAGTVATAPSKEHHQIYGAYPTMGFKPSNAFYPIDVGYEPVEAGDLSSPLRIACVCPFYYCFVLLFLCCSSESVMG